MSESKNCAIVALDLRWSSPIIEEREIALKILVIRPFIRPCFGSSLDSWLPLDACFRLHPSILSLPCRPVDWLMPRLSVIDAASLLQAVAVRPGRVWALATKKKKHTRAGCSRYSSRGNSNLPRFLPNALFYGR